MVKSEERRKMIEDQLVGFKYGNGIAYIDATEHIIINNSIREL